MLKEAARTPDKYVLSRICAQFSNDTVHHLMPKGVETGEDAEAKSAQTSAGDEKRHRAEEKLCAGAEPGRVEEEEDECAFSGCDGILVEC